MRTLRNRERNPPQPRQPPPPPSPHVQPAEVKALLDEYANVDAKHLANLDVRRRDEAKRVVVADEQEDGASGLCCVGGGGSGGGEFDDDSATLLTEFSLQDIDHLENLLHGELQPAGEGKQGMSSAVLPNTHD